MIYTHNGILLGHKKNKIMPFAAPWIGLETLILSEVSQKEKDKYHMILHIWNLIHGTNEKKIIDLKNRLVAKQKGEREWDGLGTWS